jgi:hypothetical protein
LCDQVLDRPDGHVVLEKAVATLHSEGACRSKKWPDVFIADVCQFDPFSKSFDAFQMERNLPFFPTFAEDIENMVLRMTPIVADLEPD